MKGYAFGIIMILVALLVGIFEMRGAKDKETITDFRAQINKVCEVGVQVWYDEQKDRPGFDPALAVSCITDANGNKKVMFVRHTLDGYTGKTVYYGGIVKPYKE